MNLNKQRRGFAAMDPAKQRELAARGGRAAHRNGTAHEFTVEEARTAGRRGGLAVSRDRDWMSTLGRRSAASRAERLRLRKQQLEQSPPQVTE